jgi:hypothetical protein
MQSVIDESGLGAVTELILASVAQCFPIFADSDATKRTPWHYAARGCPDLTHSGAWLPKQERVLGVAVEVNQNVKWGREPRSHEINRKHRCP